MSKTWGFFFVAQDMVLSDRAKFQLIINFFRVKAISTGLFSEDELKRIRNAVYDKQIFLIVDESTVSGTQYLNILVGSLETPHVSYLYDCQPLKCARYSNIIA